MKHIRVRLSAAMLLAGGLWFSFYNVPSALAASIPTVPNPSLPQNVVSGYGPAEGFVTETPTPTEQTPITPTTPTPIVVSDEECGVALQCPVPSPTVEFPRQNQTMKSNAAIIGLSWNNTLVDVYIDGELNGRATFLPDESGVGSFAFTPTSISIGSHNLYTVAHNASGTERSPRSTLIQFSVSAVSSTVSHDVGDSDTEGTTSMEEPAMQPADSTGEMSAPDETVMTDNKTTVDTTVDDDDNNAGSFLEEFFGEDDDEMTEETEEVDESDEQSISTTSTAGLTTTGRATILVILAAIVIAIIANHFRKKGGSDDNDDEPKGENTSSSDMPKKKSDDLPMSDMPPPA